MRTFLTLVALALAAGGCGGPSTMKLSDEDRANIKSAKISETVDTPALPFLVGQSVGVIFGGMGGAIPQNTIDDDRLPFQYFLETNSISIEQIVRGEIEQALRGSGKIAIADVKDASAPTISIVVREYGFGVKTGLSNDVVPLLWIDCSMVDNSGKRLWSANERVRVSPENPFGSTTWKQLHDNPKVITEKWRDASRYLARKIVEDL
jgi:hypothetical protein